MIIRVAIFNDVNHRNYIMQNTVISNLSLRMISFYRSYKKRTRQPDRWSSEANSHERRTPSVSIQTGHTIRYRCFAVASKHEQSAATC